MSFTACHAISLDKQPFLLKTRFSNFEAISQLSSSAPSVTAQSVSQALCLALLSVSMHRTQDLLAGLYV